MARLTGSRDRLGFALCLSTGTTTTATTATAAPPIDPPVYPDRWAMVAMALTSADTSLPLTALFAVLLAFWTTTLEIAADAWHIELFPAQDRQGQIVAANLWGYRMAMVAAGSGGLRQQVGQHRRIDLGHQRLRLRRDDRREHPTISRTAPPGRCRCPAAGSSATDRHAGVDTVSNCNATLSAMLCLGWPASTPAIRSCRYGTRNEKAEMRPCGQSAGKFSWLADGLFVYRGEADHLPHRNIKDWVTLDDVGVEIHLVKEGVVLSRESRSSEKFMHGIKVLMAKNYIDNLSEEARKGMQEKAQQGLWPSLAPLGCLNGRSAEGRKIIDVDPENGPIIARLFERGSTGAFTLRALRDGAREAGLRYRRSGKPVGISIIHYILRNRICSGQFEWNGQLCHGNHMPLVSSETWETVQSVLDGRSLSNVRADPHEFTFTGLVTCGHCSCTMTAEIKKGRYIYYHCTGHRGKCDEPYVR